MTAVDTVIAELQQERRSQTDEFIRCVNVDLQNALLFLQASSLATKIPAHTILSNNTGALAVPLPNTLTSIIDADIDNTQGDILFRGASAWVALLAASQVGALLQSGGAAANPSWTTLGQIVGEPSNANAAAGNIGEFMSVSQARTIAFPVSGAAHDICNITLTPGDWDVQGQIAVVTTDSTTFVTDAGVQFSPGAADDVDGVASSSFYGVFASVTNDTELHIPSMTLRYSVATATTQVVTLTGYLEFNGTGFCRAGGYIRARRMR